MTPSDSNQNDDAETIYTLGHSNRERDEFLQILFTHGIATLVDVRRYPGSTRYPHFNRGNLETYLPDTGISYAFLGEQLGGYVENEQDLDHVDEIAGWEADGFKRYAAYTETDAFEQGLDQLIETAREHTTAFMCAEAWYRKCHRQLIADQLVARGWTVHHIQSTNQTEEHDPLDFVRIKENRAIYRDH